MCLTLASDHNIWNTQSRPQAAAARLEVQLAALRDQLIDAQRRRDDAVTAAAATEHTLKVRASPPAFVLSLLFLCSCDGFAVGWLVCRFQCNCMSMFAMIVDESKHHLFHWMY